MKPTIRPLAVAVGVLVVLSTSCAKASNNRPGGRPSGGSSPMPHPTAPNDLVLRVETGGGLLSPASALSRVPEFSLYGDGRVITEGAQIQIYPGPALPNLRVTPVSKEAVSAILRAAGSAGLLGPDRRYAMAPVADAPTTTFTVVAGGRRHVTSVYALGFDVPAGQVPADERRARVALAAFRTKLSSLGSWLPAGSIGRDQAFDPTGIRVFVSRGGPPAQPGLERRAVAWPLATPLADFGHPLSDWPDLRCGTVAGSDLARLLADAQRADQLTPWRSGGATYTLTFRPLLPDESGCPG